MKRERGAILISIETLTKILKDKIPSDFRLSGLDYEPATNTIKLHGTSVFFHEAPEYAQHMVEVTVLAKEDDYAPAPRERVGKGNWWKFW